MYVSITGLTINGILRAPLFWWHAVGSFKQARTAPGNISAEVRKIGQVQHTLTVWEDREAMRRFIYSGAHKQAIRAFHRIGSGRVGGYETDRLPTWEEALIFWQEHARSY